MASMLPTRCVCVLASAAIVADAVTRISLQRGGQAAKREGAAGDVALRNDRDVFYYAEVEVGTPGQAIRVAFDTESTNSWLPTHAALGPASSHAWYAPDQSSSHRRINRGFHDTRADGVWARDQLKLGPLRLNRFEFGAVTSIKNISSTYADFPWDGVVGLAFSDVSVPFLQMLVKEKQIDEAVFAFFLDRQGKRSELSLGGPDPERHQGDFHYFDLAADHGKLWRVDLDDVWVGYIRCFRGAQRAYANPWISFVHGPDDQINFFAEAWGSTRDADGWFPIPCDKDGPSLVFRIHGRDFELTKEDLLIKFNSKCFLGINQDSDVSWWDLGQVFHRKFYTLFDAGRKRLGFSLARHPSNNSV